MRDQADSLRALATVARHVVPEPSHEGGAARIIAVSSGKGGVGKTNLVVNLALAFSNFGRRVTILDADLGTANVDVVMGITPRYNLEHVIRGQIGIYEALADGPRNTRVIPGGSGLWELANLNEADRARLINALSRLEDTTDVLLIDTGAGISANVIEFLVAAKEVLVLTTPEPTATADAYALIKVASQASDDIRFKLVVNFANDNRDAGLVSQRIISVAKRFLNVDVEDYGYLPLDPNLARAVRRQVPLLLAYPNSPWSIRLYTLGRSLLQNSVQVSSQSGIGAFLRRLARIPC